MEDATVRSSTRAQRLGPTQLATRRLEVSLAGFDFSTPIDHSRWFVCPTLTPLYYAPVYRELNEHQQRRYNQLTALCFSELISFFETSFASSVLAVLARGRRYNIDRELATCLEGFVSDEREHTGWWRRLNELSEPKWYTDRQRVIIRLPPAVRFLLQQLTSRPEWFPMVFFVMLALEERSLEISRRCMQMPTDKIEPRYLAIYRTHLKHEARHVQLDRQLIERFYARMSPLRRRLNARLLRLAIGRFFLPPTRSAVRVVRRLVAECPELLSLRRLVEAQLAQVGEDEAYQEMMYSRYSTPITFSLFDRFPELHAMRYVLLCYEPQ